MPERILEQRMMLNPRMLTVLSQEVGRSKARRGNGLGLLHLHRHSCIDEHFGRGQNKLESFVNMVGGCRFVMKLQKQEDRIIYDF